MRCLYPYSTIAPHPLTSYLNHILTDSYPANAKEVENVEKDLCDGHPDDDNVKQVA